MKKLLFLSLLFSVLFIVPSIWAHEEADASAKEAETNQAPSNVVVLSAANFTEAIQKNKFIFVEFYAPWCGTRSSPFFVKHLICDEQFAFRTLQKFGS